MDTPEVSVGIDGDGIPPPALLRPALIAGGASVEQVQTDLGQSSLVNTSADLHPLAR